MNPSNSVVTEVPTPPQALVSAGLTDPDFSDAYCGDILHRQVTALQAAQAALGSPPGWVNSLMSVRDGVVGLFGLKTSSQLRAQSKGESHGGTVGIFTVRHHAPAELVLGEDDKHLDFRIWVHVAPNGDGCRITISTVVCTHNRLGRAYLATIMPFHRLISQQLLARALNHFNGVNARAA